MAGGARGSWHDAMALAASAWLSAIASY